MTATPATPPADQTDRRDRYAAAMAKRDGDTWPTEYEGDEADYCRRADAAIAVADAEQAELRAYEQRLREQHDHDVAELNRLRARIVELERPAVEAKRAEIRDSYAELIAAAQETKDYEGAFDVQCRLHEREEQWKREDATPAGA